jgi:L,D-transpeptidase catalytic domain/Putative peptidoglycan binding domain
VKHVFRTTLVLLAVCGVGLLAGAGYALASKPTSSAGRGSGPTTTPADAPPSSDPSPEQTESATPTPSETAPATPTTTPTPTAPPALWSLGDRSSKVRGLEARLVQLRLLDPRRVDGYYGTATRSAVSSLQQSQGLTVTGAVDALTWAHLRAMTHLPTHAELYPVIAETHSAMRIDPRCLTGHALCIDKTTQQLAWVVDGKVVMELDVRFGSQFHPTREGQFSVYAKDIDHVSTLYGSSMPYAMFFSGGEAVHYSSDFAARGYAGHSHGCVNVRDKAGIAKLFGLVHIGDKVVVYRG